MNLPQYIRSLSTAEQLDLIATIAPLRETGDVPPLLREHIQRFTQASPVPDKSPGVWMRFVQEEAMYQYIQRCLTWHSAQTPPPDGIAVLLDTGNATLIASYQEISGQWDFEDTRKWLHTKENALPASEWLWQPLPRPQRPQSTAAQPLAEEAQRP